MNAQRAGRWVDAGFQVAADIGVAIWFTLGDAWHTIRRTR